MSSSINIPTTSSSSGQYRAASKTDDSSPRSSYSSSSSTPPTPKTENKKVHNRRPSLLSSAFTQHEHTVIDIGAPDGPPRLISYLSSSQGFMWNPELFLPSYVEHEYVPLENRRDPVHEIHLSEEEAKNMLPK